MSTEQKGPIWMSDRKVDPLSKVIEELKGIRDQFASERDVHASDVRKLEERVEDLFGQMKALQAKIKKKSEEVVKERKLSSNTAKMLARIQNFIGNPDEVVNKAKLFDAGVLKEGLQLGPKLVSVLVDYGEKMETTLLEMKTIMIQICHLICIHQITPKEGKKILECNCIVCH